MVTSVTSTSGSSTSTSTSNSTTSKSATGQNVMKALGSGSGIDTASLAQSLVDAEKAPRADAINKNIKKSEAIVSGYAAVKYALNAVKTAFDDLKDVSDFSSVTATSNQIDIFSVTTSTGTQAGSHSILVTQLAQEQRIASENTFEAGDTVNGTPFELRVIKGDAPKQIIYVTDTSPAGVVDAINKSNTGLNAQLVNTGNGYKITVAGTSGSSNGFAIDSMQATNLSFGDWQDRGQTSVSSQSFADTDPVNISEILLDNDPNPITFTPGLNPKAFAEAFTNSPQAVAKRLQANFRSDGKLEVIGLQSGSGKGFSLVTSNGLALAFNVTKTAQTNAPKKVLQEATDAKLQVDGLPISSTSNAVSGVIPGVTLNLTGVNATQANGDISAKGSPASLSLAIDTSVAKAKITALVTAYNDANDLLDQVSNPKSTLATYGGTLVGNSSVRSMRDQLRTLVTQDFYSGGSFATALKAKGLDPKDKSTWPTGTALKDKAPSALRDIGIEIDSKGKLSTNSVKLDMALNLNFADTVRMLSGNQENQSASDKLNASGLAGDASKSLTALLSASGAITTETANATKRITKYQDDLTTLEDRMTRILARYQKQFSAMDSMVGQTKATQTGLTSTFAGMMSMYTNK